MILRTDKGERIQTRNGETPHYSEFHKRWYVAGFRFIRTKQTFSGSCLLHSFKSFEIEE